MLKLTRRQALADRSGLAKALSSAGHDEGARCARLTREAQIKPD
jgi:hypothetical protein